MRVLILGASGMLGHKLCQRYRDRFEVWATVRGSAAALGRFGLFDLSRLVSGVDATDFQSIVRAVATVRPDAVINCIGIIKQLPTAKLPIPSIAINSLFPHQLAQLCQAAGARLVHISTDCVFSGRKGGYTEDDPSDAEDLYGRSKFLGEVNEAPGITLRTSIIGRELQSRSGLIEWLISQRGGEAAGYARAIYTGFTTLALAEIIATVLEKHQDLNGLWQVSSDPINKHDLLVLANRALGLEVTLSKDETFVCDRSLDSTRFRKATGIRLPSWPEMIAQLAADPTPYDQFKR